LDCETDLYRPQAQKSSIVLMIGHSPLAAQRDDLFRGSFSVTQDPLALLAAETSSIRESSDLVDSTLELANATTHKIRSQTTMMNNSNNNLQKYVAAVPIIGGLVKKIDVKRKRDRLVLGGLIGVLMFFCVWYLFG
jgi:Golgi SNAP receptor complex protein 1